MPGIDEEEDEAGHIDSRHLPVEPRTKVETLYQQSTPPQQRIISYAPVAPKQSTPNQPLYSDDEYLDLIRNTDLVKNAQALSSKSPYGYVTATPSTAIDNNYDYSTKSPYNNNEYKRYTSRTQPSTASSPIPNLQPQTSQQQFVRQPPTHYIAQSAGTHFVTAGPSQDYSQSYDKDTIRVSLKKYHEPAGKTKYDPARGQYHQEVTVKPTKKVVSFKPSYQYGSTPQVQLASSNQESVVQQQPLHYQSIQQISQTDPNSGQQHLSPQSQYSIVVPQAHQAQQQAYFSSESNNPFQSFLPQNERLVANNYAQTEQKPQNYEQKQQNYEQKQQNYEQKQQNYEHLTVPQTLQQNDNRPNAPNEFRIQYLHHVSPTPTPTPRPRYVSDNTPGHQLKYELYDPNGNVNAPKDSPKIKIVQAPQHVHRPQYAEAPQYYKKIKIQPAAHVHYLPVRPQYHQQTAQPPQQQAASQGQSDILIPIQPSRTTLFVGTNQGNETSISAFSKNLGKFLLIFSLHQRSK